MSNCVCGGHLGATGVDGCIITFKTTNNFILMPTYKADRTRNSLDLTSPTLGADIIAMREITTPMLERLYPLPSAENVTRAKTERVIETAPSGNIYIVQDGLRQNSMELWGDKGSIRGLEQLQLFGCTDMSYFAVDIDGTIEGYKDSANSTELFPFPIMDNSYFAEFDYATDTTINKLMLSFNLQRNFDESKIYYLTSADLGFNATSLRGLIGASQSVSNITTTGVTVRVGKLSGSALAFKPLAGLLVTDFTLTNVTGASPVALTGMTETSPGVYVLTYADVVGVNMFKLEALRLGYDIQAVTYADPA